MVMFYHGTWKLDIYVFFSLAVIILMRIINKWSHFICHFKRLVSNFGHVNPDSVFDLFKSYSC